MGVTILWWYWLIFGMILILGELLIPSFTLFWFGLAALLLGSVLFFMPHLSLNLQLIGWTVASIVFTILWFKYFKPTMVDRTKAGISREAVTGQTGIVIRAPQQGLRGIVRFSLPLLGADEWEFISSTSCQVGDRVEVIDVSGNTLIVTPKP
ncbi:MAG: NfeD family protein [Desulfofustis sp.]|nr:NfeD family protein [Desulfofustis sp.]